MKELTSGAARSALLEGCLFSYLRTTPTSAWHAINDLSSFSVYLQTIASLAHYSDN